MAKNKQRKQPIPELFESFEALADFWDTHDLADYTEHLTPVDVDVSDHPTQEYVVVLSDTLDSLLHDIQRREGVSVNTLVNLWVQEKLLQYEQVES